MPMIAVGCYHLLFYQLSGYHPQFYNCAVPSHSDHPTHIIVGWGVQIQVFAHDMVVTLAKPWH